ncbi:MAG: Rieske 2Fe-2S domain-containing protein [Acidimicrobiia bacterium]
MKGFKHETIANGWYQIGWTTDFEAERLTPLRYFGEALAATRGADGSIHVMDAICSHFGANLGVAGRVDDGCVVCPFHGWRWGLDGRNVSIPYSAHGPLEVRLRTWPVVEQAGLVFAWHGPPDDSPAWELPALLPDDGREWLALPVATRLWRDLHIVPQVVSENSVDAAHFVYVHGSADVPSMTACEDRGPIFYTSYEMAFGAPDHPTWATPDGPLRGSITNQCFGVGMTLALLEAFDAVLNLASTTPIDVDRSDHRSTVWVAAQRRDGAAVTPDLQMRWAEQQFAQIEADFDIMENLSYRVRPVLAREEIAPIRALRKWADRFYGTDGKAEVSCG